MVAPSAVPSRQHRLLLTVALLLIFGGALLASLIQTSGGVTLRDVRFPASGGLQMSALLYVPPNATPEHPAPGVLAVHGYINSRETQSPYAIEFARRGYVVLAIDQTGHGYSDPPAFANGYGGPDGLTYLRSLDIVDKRQIVLEGHSMGGWATLIAAGAQRDGYTSIVVSGSSTGTLGAPDGDATFPRNLGLVYSRYDEFSGLMWGSPVAGNIVDTPKLEKLFGTDATVQVESLYGSIASGTARKLWMPSETHPMNHITHAGITPVIDWVQQTSKAPHPLPVSDQIWAWKELGTTLSLFGAIVLLFAVGGLLLATPFFSELREAPRAARGLSGAPYWIAMLLGMAIPILLYVPVQDYIGKEIKAGPILSQNLTTGLMFWALASGLIALASFYVWHLRSASARGVGALDYGLAWPAQTGRNIARSFALAFAVVAAAYLSLVLADLIFKTDFRMWVVAAKPLGLLHVRIALCYLLPFTAYFVVSALVAHGQLRNPSASDTLLAAMVQNAVLAGGGFVVFMIVQYVPLLSGGTLAFPDAHLLTILGFQLLFVLPVTGLISTFFFRETGHVYAGAFVNGLFVTWLLVGGQATHYAF